MKYILTDSETYGEMVDAPEPTTFGIEGHWLVEYVNRHTCGTEEGGHFGAHERGCGSLPALDLSQAEGWDRHVAAIKAEAWDEGWAARADRKHLKVGECVPAPSHINPYRAGRIEVRP